MVDLLEGQKAVCSADQKVKKMAVSMAVLLAARWAGLAGLWAVEMAASKGFRLGVQRAARWAECLAGSRAALWGSCWAARWAVSLAG
jgi:hypothetical protein